MTNKRSLLVLTAQVAEQANRYDDMATCMKMVVEKDEGLSDGERDMFSLAYMNAIRERRASWRTLYRLSQKRDPAAKLKMINEYKDEIAKELQNTCNEMLTLLDGYILKRELSLENMIFFWTLKGDYLRYLVEIGQGDQKVSDKIKADAAYKAAMDVAKSELAPTHPIRLGLALNFSIFLYETCNNPDKACKVAIEAIDMAVAEMEKISQEAYDNSTHVMQKLRDNLLMWTGSRGAPTA